LKFVIQEEAAPKTKIRVFGVGGGGCNAVARMLNEGLAGVEFCVLNTDVQALAVSVLAHRVRLSAQARHEGRTEAGLVDRLLRSVEIPT